MNILLALLAGAAGGIAVLAVYRVSAVLAHRAQTARDQHVQAVLQDQWRSVFDDIKRAVDDKLDQQRRDLTVGITFPDESVPDDPDAEDEEVKRERQNPTFYG